MKQIIRNKQAMIGLEAGISELAHAVKSTMGPLGRNVIIDQEHDYPLMTKDGVTVAKSIFLEGKAESIGARLIKEVAEKTESMAGDGTTTSIVLAEEIILGGLKLVRNGADPLALKRGIDRTVAAIVSNLHAQAEDVKGIADIADIAKISANNNKEIGELVADAFDQAGEDGVVTVEDSEDFNTKIHTVNGMQFDRGYFSPYFVTNTKNETSELADPYVLVFSGDIGVVDEDFSNLLEACKRAGRSLVIIAKDVSGTALSTLVTNKIGNVLKVVAIKAPGFGEWQRGLMEDIAVATGATVVKSMKEVNPSVLGGAEAVTSGRNSTTIVGGFSTDEAIVKRCDELSKLMAKEPKESVEHKKYTERIAKLAGGVSVIYVGGASELEAKEKKDRVIDAVHAVRSAKEEGIVNGGGIALMDASSVVNGGLKLTTHNTDEISGMLLIKEVCAAPFRTILINAGYNPDIIRERLMHHESCNGFNSKTGEYADMKQDGIIDPVKVTRCALQNAASVAGMILTTSCIVTDAED